MNIDFHRLPGGYCSQAVRDDGVTVYVPGFDRKHEVPHDLAHFAAEHGFGVRRGFWGSVAAGAMFGGMKVLAGRRPPHATERSRTIIRTNAEEIGNAEALAAVAYQACTDNVSPAVAARRLSSYWSRVHPGRCPYTTADMARACELLESLSTRWHEVTIGTTMTVTWDLPVDSPKPPRHPRPQPIRR